MLEFFKSDIEVVKQRLKNRVIISVILSVLYFVFVSQEILEALLLILLVAGISYGWNLIANIGRAPVDMDGEPYQPGGIAGLAIRIALAVGIGLAMTGGVNIWLAVTLIGAVTFLLSGVGVKIGSMFGARFEKKAQIFGGVMLILLGLKILLEHLGVL